MWEIKNRNKKWGSYFHLLIVLCMVSNSAHGKRYKTEDSVVLEGDPLPGPSIFEYKNEALLLSTGHLNSDQIPSPSTDSDSGSKVKRGGTKDKENENSSSSSLSSEKHHTHYFEMAGNQLYVFEPSALGAAPFMDALSSQEHQDRPQHSTQNNNFHHQNRNHNHNYVPRPRPRPQIPQIPPNVLVKANSQPSLPRFNFDSIKIEQVTPRDAVPSSSGNRYHHGFGQLALKNEASSSSQQRDISQTEADSESEQNSSECLSANEKQGQCVPFHLCYPVVYNSVTGELKNYGLARMLYQASGPCRGGNGENDTWTIHAVNVQVQPGVQSYVPLEIPPDFFNHTVCCPGYFYFENTIPHHYTPNAALSSKIKAKAKEAENKNSLKEKESKAIKLKLLLRPSQPDPMLTPQQLQQEQEGRSLLKHYNSLSHPQQYPHKNLPRLPLLMQQQLSRPPPHLHNNHRPPQIFYHSHQIFGPHSNSGDNTAEQNPQMGDDDYNYYDSFEGNYDYITHHTTPRPSTNRSTTTSTPTSTQNSATKDSKSEPRTKKDESSKNMNSTETVVVRNSRDEGSDPDESTMSEVKVGAKKEKTKTKEGESSTNSETVENSPPTKKPKKTRKKPKNATNSTTTIHHETLASPPVVVISPPHLSAWNCPGKQVMPRGHWPWLVALLNEGSHFCSGSLIDHRHVLTSASCVAGYQGTDIGKMRVILGDRVLYSSVDGPHVWRKILRITRHLQFNPETMEHDIAILEMDTMVVFTSNIQPINLPSTSNKGHTDRAIISGWSGADLGKRFFSARPVVDTVVEFMDGDTCHKHYKGFKTENAPPENIICTKPSTDSCKADLGAPLMMKTGNCWHVIGILSHGLGCSMFPEIYTDTAKYLPWITKNLRHHFDSQDTFLKT